MTIICSNCETAQFLQIVQSRVYFEDGEMLDEINESYECTMCDATGEYIYDRTRGDEIVKGDVEKTDGRPKYA